MHRLSDVRKGDVSNVNYSACTFELQNAISPPLDVPLLGDLWRNCEKVEERPRRSEQDDVPPFPWAELTIISEVATRGRSFLPGFPRGFLSLARDPADNSSEGQRESARLSICAVYLSWGYFESSPLVRK